MNASAKHTPSIGDVFRDTYGDNDLRTVSLAVLNQRTIRIIDFGPDGRYLAEVLTSADGSVLKRPRITRLSEKTLRAGYVPALSRASGEGK